MSVRITPVNQKAYENNPNFTNIDPQGNRYATLGAGPKGGKLVSNPNRDKDINLKIKVQNQSINLKGRNEDEIIAQLFKKDSNYEDNLRYEKFPDAGDDSYNSNSYTRGILDSVGLDAPQPGYKVPGCNKPVPSKHFECKGQN